MAISRNAGMKKLKAGRLIQSTKSLSFPYKLDEHTGKNALTYGIIPV